MTSTLTPEQIADKIGAAQKRTILSLSGEWGRAASHAAAKRLWYRNDIPLLLDHKHCTDNCWLLRPIGLSVRKVLQDREQGGGHD